MRKNAHHFCCVILIEPLNSHTFAVKITEKSNFMVTRIELLFLPPTKDEVIEIKKGTSRTANIIEESHY